jgi:hypothetical protein
VQHAPAGGIEGRPTFEYIEGVSHPRENVGDLRALPERLLCWNPFLYRAKEHQGLLSRYLAAQPNSTCPVGLSSLLDARHARLTSLRPLTSNNT